MPPGPGTRLRPEPSQPSRTAGSARSSGASAECDRTPAGRKDNSVRRPQATGDRQRRGMSRSACDGRTLRRDPEGTQETSLLAAAGPLLLDTDVVGPVPARVVLRRAASCCVTGPFASVSAQGELRQPNTGKIRLIVVLALEATGRSARAGPAWVPWWRIGNATNFVPANRDLFVRECVSATT